MEGVMMRNADVYGLAVRRPDGSIVAIRRPWRTFFSHPFFKLPVIRGFPVLVDTLYNGVGALNKSAELAEADESQKVTNLQLVASMIIAVIMAVGLFVLAPHFLSLLMFFLHIGGNVEGFSFHIWDGFFKACIFFGYLWLISLMPDIRRVLCYHGAEHKTIHAFEQAQCISQTSTRRQSRFHPRCGTTFLLFVIALSILLHAVLVPPLLALIAPDGEIVKHSLGIAIKILLIVPISAFSYELIRYAAKLRNSAAKHVFQAPGLFLQRLTTKEPDESQIAVALVSLAVALDECDRKLVETEAYTLED
ncbi:MAG: DUF1385 domain-containing protein [Desulfovibrio sp.]|nr:DUF1385 domain-containing protein [Desulfovibrio sp.]